MSAHAISCRSVSKRFVRGQRHDSLRDAVPAVWHWLRRRPSARLRRQQFWALREVSFELPRGEALGIIGPNGAGKSTLLRLLSRILVPDSGHVDISGRLTALIEVGAGFHQDLSGRENIFLNGAILGMTRREISARIDHIIDFAGVSEFIDTPVKRYSSGMQARLGFAVAAHMDPEILLVDEVLAVGDARFQQRCLDKMHGFARSGRSIAFISHDLQAVTELCPQTLVIIGGRREFLGPTTDAVRYYLTRMREDDDRPADGPAVIRRVRLANDDGAESARFAAGQPARLTFDVDIDAAAEDYILCFILRRATDGLIVADYNLDLPAARGRVAVDFDVNLLTGAYGVTLGLTHRATLEKHAFHDFVKLFDVAEASAYAGIAHLTPRVAAVTAPDGAVQPATAGARRDVA